MTGELERRWNETLARVSVLDERLHELEQARSSQVAIDAAELLRQRQYISFTWRRDRRILHA